MPTISKSRNPANVHARPDNWNPHFTPEDDGPPGDDWLEPERDFAGRKYLSENCLSIPFRDFKAIRQHAVDLYHLGLSRDWAAYWLARMIDSSWINDAGAKRELREAVLDGYRKAKMIGEVSVPDDDEPNRLAGKSLEYFDNLPNLTWLWQGMLAENSFFVLYGKEKSGKTFFALALALSIAAGLEFCGLQVHQGRVLYVIAEGNEKEFRNRLRVWLKRHPKAIDAIRENFRAVTVPVMINQPEQVKALLDQNPDDWDLVVIDTYLRNTSGNVNDPKDAVAFVRGVDAIRERSGAAVIAVHHEGKDGRRGAFGSMHLTGACDGAAVVMRESVGNLRRFQIKLMRNGDDSQEDIAFRLAPAVAAWDDGGEQSSCLVEFIDRRGRADKEEPEASKPDDSSETILRLIRDHEPESAKSLGKISGLALRSLFRRLGELRQDGLLDGLALTPKARERLADHDEDDHE
jgi:hypothetical protein